MRSSSYEYEYAAHAYQQELLRHHQLQHQQQMLLVEQQQQAAHQQQQQYHQHLLLQQYQQQLEARAQFQAQMEAHMAQVELQQQQQQHHQAQIQQQRALHSAPMTPFTSTMTFGPTSNDRVRMLEEENAKLVERIEQVETDASIKLSLVESQLHHSRSQLEAKEAERSSTEQVEEHQSDASKIALLESRKRKAETDLRTTTKRVKEVEAELKEQKAENEQLKLICSVCQDVKPELVYLPCGHITCCQECDSHLSTRRCPNCRQMIEQTAVVYF